MRNRYGSATGRRRVINPAVDAIPTGMVTFLFSDIEGSTERVRAVGDERWAELLELHRSLMRRGFVAHGGAEFGSEGDACFVAFGSALDAVLAATEAQRAIEGHAWPEEARIRVRIGLHTGEAVVRDGDYVGHALHLTKRVCGPVRAC